MAVTLKDISSETGFNVGSISNVLNNHPKAIELKEETRQKIRKAAQRLGYCRNEMARAIVTKRARVIAFVSADMGLVSYTGKIQEGVFEEASEYGYAVSFYHLTADNQQEVIRKIKAWQICGVIFHVCVSTMVAGLIDELKTLGIPYGMVNLRCSGETGIGITTDDFQGAVDVMKYLGELGHRRIAHLTLSEEVHLENECLANRQDGYLEGIRQYVPGAQPRIIDVGIDSCANACKLLLAEPESTRPTAVFCCMDTWAMELMRTAFSLGIRVPQDLSIVGFGNLDMAEFAAVPLTSVSQPFKSMGSLATAKVIEVIQNANPTKKSNNFKLKTDLVVRDSTAR